MLQLLYYIPYSPGIPPGSEKARREPQSLLLPVPPDKSAGELSAGSIFKCCLVLEAVKPLHSSERDRQVIVGRPGSIICYTGLTPQP